MNINPQIVRDAIQALEYWATTSGSPNFTDRHQMHEPTKRALHWMRSALSTYEGGA